MNSLDWIIEWVLFLIVLGDAIVITPWVWPLVIAFWPLVFFSVWLAKR